MQRYIAYRRVGDTSWTPYAVPAQRPFSITGLAAGQYDVDDFNGSLIRVTVT